MTLRKSFRIGYHYVKFDFSSVNTTGIYYIQYGDFKTNNFLIENNVYDKITDATSDIWIPIHMNHMFVNEAYRVWHGEPFKDGYLQAPPNTDHFDIHSQGPTTDSKYRAGWGGGSANMATNLQLYISTGEQQYINKFQELLWPALESNVSFVILTAIHAIPHMDATFKEKLRPYVVKYKEYIDGLEKDNPYGVPIGLRNWAGSGCFCCAK